MREIALKGPEAVAFSAAWAAIKDWAKRMGYKVDDLP